VTAEWIAVADGEPKIAIGGEYALSQVLFLRAGYTFVGSGDLGGPAAGIGVAFPTGVFQAKLDYTYRPQLWNGWESVAGNHLLSLGASF